MERPYTIRPFASTRDYRECVELQEATWGEGFSERVSPAILKVGQILGGVSAGAYDEDGRLAGFVFGLTGIRDGRAVHWSDMLAVRPGIRDAGLGRRLKEYQREDLLSRGVDTMYWTFDPLQSRNAHLNIARLGAVVREYRIDMYGESDSPLHRGIGTDRFVALWLMDSDRVKACLARSSREGGGVPADGESSEGGGPADPDQRPGPSKGIPFALQAGPVDARGHPEPGQPDLSLGNAAVRVAIPFDVGDLMDDDLELAIAWRTATRAVFEHYMSRGYEVTGFERGRPASAYVLRRHPDGTPSDPGAGRGVESNR